MLHAITSLNHVWVSLHCPQMHPFADGQPRMAHTVDSTDTQYDKQISFKS